VLGVNLGKAGPDIDARHHGSYASSAREQELAGLSASFDFAQDRLLKSCPSPGLHERGRSRLHHKIPTLTSQSALR
jgi:hypothetical protein